MTRLWCWVAVIGWTLGGLTGSAWGQSADERPFEDPENVEEEVPERPESPWAHVEVFARHEFQTDFDDPGGDVSVTRVGGGAGIGGFVAAPLILGAGLNVEYSHYSFDGFEGFDVAIDDVVSYGLRPYATFMVSREWAITGGFIVNLAGEPDADVGDSLSGGGFVGARYRAGENLSITGGLVLVSVIEEDLQVFPLISVNWQVTDRLHLGTEGSGVRVGYQLDEPLTVYLKAGYETRNFRLADDNPLLPAGVLRDDRIPVTLGLEFHPHEHLTADFHVGAIAYQKIALENSTGRELTDVDSGPSPFLGVLVRWDF